MNCEKRDRKNAVLLLETLAYWQGQETQVLADALKRLQDIKFTSIQFLKGVLSGLIAFNKEISEAEEEKKGAVNSEIFTLVVRLKKNLKKQETLLTTRTGKKKVQKNDSNQAIHLSKRFYHYVEFKSIHEKKILFSLYKNFMEGFPEGQNIYEQETVGFIEKLYRKLHERYYLSSCYYDKIDRVCLSFRNKASSAHKVRMITGKMTLNDIIENKEEMYIKEETRRRQLEIIREGLRLTGFGGIGIPLNSKKTI